ncbi:MAG: baseplate J/gp47 family protein [Anaerolineae bacterium]
MAQVVEALPDESLSAIRSKLLAASERDVILVVPRGTRAMQTPVGAKVVARAVLDHRLRLAIVTRDATTYRHASDAGLSVFSSVERAESARAWRTPPRPEGPVSVRRESTPGPASAPHAEPASWAERILGLTLLVILLMAVGGGTAFLLPEATISLKPASHELAVEVRLSVVPGLEEIDYASVAIPGRKVTTILTGTGSQATTSRRDMPDAPAKGTVILVNQRALEVTVPAGTIVATGSGTPVRFRTTADVHLPGISGVSAPVPVEAIDPGPQGNVGAYVINRIEGPLAAQISVINEQPTEGGSVRQVGAVTEADRERLRQSLLQRLELEAHTVLQSMLQPGETSVRDSLQLSRIMGEGFDKLLGEAADQITLTLRAEYEEVAFAEADANRIALAGLQGAVPQGYQLLADGLRFQITNTERAEDGTLLVTVVASGIVRAQIDPAEAKSLVLGMPAREAEERLNQAFFLAEPAKVSTKPGWAAGVPRFGFRVHVDLVY